MHFAAPSTRSITNGPTTRRASATVDLPLMSFARCPTPSSSNLASTPQRPKTLIGQLGATLADPVPPAWSLTTSAVSSARPSWACCIPLPTMRFDAFPTSSFPRTNRPLDLCRLPRTAYTPRRIPLIYSRTASPRPLPSWGSRSLLQLVPAYAGSLGGRGEPRLPSPLRGVPEHIADLQNLPCIDEAPTACEQEVSTSSSVSAEAATPTLRSLVATDESARPRPVTEVSRSAKQRESNFSRQPGNDRWANDELTLQAPRGEC